MALFPWKREAISQMDGGVNPEPLIPRIKVTTAAAALPVTAAELAELLKLTGNDENAVLTRYLEAATKLAETHTGRAFVNRTLEVWLDAFPVTDKLLLPIAPVSAISSVQYYADGEATPTAFASTNYIADLVSSPARVVLEKGSTWPTDLRSANAVVITLTAGYGDADDVPEAIKAAILSIAAEAYHAQGAQVEAEDMRRKLLIPQDAFLMLEPFRISR